MIKCVNDFLTVKDSTRVRIAVGSVHISCTAVETRSKFETLEVANTLAYFNTLICVDLELGIIKIIHRQAESVDS
jgi:hypothetical protein